ncbi:MAG: tRNA (adenosine(37)-N6)-threonylcarbamoyltransferase complex dimerization subunit type 1 TsaB [Lachnospiraceae bacterium]|nr:tRNA (adenosine(37)-N6)-threonylcarbamoyltransferase complex dimerization subunit type 1 TsaB [Lachnospiraceae bacterium]
MKLIALDSSGLVASVSVIEDDILVAEYTIQYKKTHSQTLLPMLDEIRNMIELDFDAVDGIAVAAGPGSFTGLRIGSATAKGLAFAMGKPIVPVPTVDGLAYNLYGTDKIVCPIMDARRSQVYTGIYEFVLEDGIYSLHIIREQCAVAFAEIADSLNELGREVIFLGDGVPVFKEEMKSLMKVPYTFAPAHMNRQRAASIGVLGSIYFAQGKIQSGEEHSPEYLRLSQAERERIRIRPMERADVERVSQMEEETFSMPWSRDSFLEMIENDNARYYVAERDGHVIGACGILMAAGEGNITNVVVDEKERNRGIGFKLLQYLIEDGLKNGLTAFTLEVRVSNAAAIHLYKKLGFFSEGIRPNFYEKPTEDAMIMWKR